MEITRRDMLKTSLALMAGASLPLKVEAATEAELPGDKWGYVLVDEYAHEDAYQEMYYPPEDCKLGYLRRKGQMSYLWPNGETHNLWYVWETPELAAFFHGNDRDFAYHHPQDWRLQAVRVANWPPHSTPSMFWTNNHWTTMTDHGGIFCGYGEYEVAYPQHMLNLPEWHLDERIAAAIMFYQRISRSDCEETLSGTRDFKLWSSFVKQHGLGTGMDIVPTREIFDSVDRWGSKLRDYLCIRFFGKAMNLPHWSWVMKRIKLNSAAQCILQACLCRSKVLRYAIDPVPCTWFDKKCADYHMATCHTIDAVKNIVIAMSFDSSPISHYKAFRYSAQHVFNKAIRARLDAEEKAVRL